jgi:hypothetical protein
MLSSNQAEVHVLTLGEQWNLAPFSKKYKSRASRSPNISLSKTSQNNLQNCSMIFLSSSEFFDLV